MSGTAPQSNYNNGHRKQHCRVTISDNKDDDGTHGKILVQACDIMFCLIVAIYDESESHGNYRLLCMHIMFNFFVV